VKRKRNENNKTLQLSVEESDESSASYCFQSLITLVILIGAQVSLMSFIIIIINIIF